jgi:hypothetical protein
MSAVDTCGAGLNGLSCSFPTHHTGPHSWEPCKASEQGRRCKPWTIAYTDAGATCTVCGAFWPMSRTDAGQPIGYITPPPPPSTKAARPSPFSAWCD